MGVWIFEYNLYIIWTRAVRTYTLPLLAPHATVGAMVRHFWCNRARWLVLPGANAWGPRVSMHESDEKEE